MKLPAKALLRGATSRLRPGWGIFWSLESGSGAKRVLLPPAPFEPAKESCHELEEAGELACGECAFLALRCGRQAGGWAGAPLLH